MKGSKEEPLKVALAPHYYSPPEDEHRTSWEFEMQLQRKNSPNDIEFYIADVTRDALLSRVRSSLITNAIVTCADVLIWIDHDISWRVPGDLADLARRCAEKESTVGGPFPFRGANMRGQGYPVRPLNGVVLEFHPARDEMWEVEFVSGGFIAFWVPQMRALLEASKKATDPFLQLPACESGGGGFFWPFCWPVWTPYDPPREDGRMNYLSDDWVVQWRARKLLGAKSWLWTRPLLRHTGRYSYGVADALGLEGSNEDNEQGYLAAAAAAAAKERMFANRESVEPGANTRLSGLDDAGKPDQKDGAR